MIAREAMYMDDLNDPEGIEFPIVCTYCRTYLNGPKAGVCDQEVCNSTCISDGICPDCLLHNFPQEYITIQRERRLRIKHIYKKGCPALNGKLEK